MISGSIRFLAICVVRHEGKILVSEGYDTQSKTHFYRLLGGEVEFGENALDAIVREFQEELSVGLKDVSLIGTLENIFTWNGQKGHEVVQVFEGKLSNESFYAKESFDVFENGEFNFRAAWKSMSDFYNGTAKLVPHGILDILK